MYYIFFFVNVAHNFVITYLQKTVLQPHECPGLWFLPVLNPLTHPDPCPPLLTPIFQHVPAHYTPPRTQGHHVILDETIHIHSKVLGLRTGRSKTTAAETVKEAEHGETGR